MSNVWAPKLHAVLAREALAMSELPRYWFRAKRYGWGWGAPSTWQGWVVVLLYGALMAVGGLRINPRQHVLLFLGYVVVVTCGLVAVCWLKGEPPKWRSGKSGA